MIEKNGMLTEDSYSDFDSSKKVRYVEKSGFVVAGEGEQDKLKDPIPLKEVERDEH